MIRKREKETGKPNLRRRERSQVIYVAEGRQRRGG
jgi:hypothetical protein